MRFSNTSKLTSFRNAKKYLLLDNKKKLTKDEFNDANKAYLRWKCINAGKDRSK